MGISKGGSHGFFRFTRPAWVTGVLEDEELAPPNVDKVMMWIQDPARVGEYLSHWLEAEHNTDITHEKEFAVPVVDNPDTYTREATPRGLIGVLYLSKLRGNVPAPTVMSPAWTWPTTALGAVAKAYR